MMNTLRTYVAYILVVMLFAMVYINMIIAAFLPTSSFQYFIRCIFDMLNIYSDCDDRERKQFEKWLYENDGGVVMFNHPTMFDHMVLMNEFGNAIRFVAFDCNLKHFPYSTLAKKQATVLISKKSNAGNSAIIQKHITERVRGEPVVCLAPTGPDQSTVIGKLAPFRTGGFLSRSSVLPVVIQYTPRLCLLNDIMGDMAKLLFEHGHVRYNLRVLPEMTPFKDEDIDTFKERVKAAMELALSSPIERDPSKPPHTYRGSLLLAFTSMMLGLPGLYILMYPSEFHQKTAYAIGMVVLSLTSIVHHSTGNAFARVLDFVVVYSFSIVFGIMCLINGYIIPLVMLMCLFMFKQMYIKMEKKISKRKQDVIHALCQHVFGTIGFIMLALC